MKVHYKRILNGDLEFVFSSQRADDTYDCQEVSIEWCCDDAKMADSEHIIGFGDEGLTYVPYMNLYQHKWGAQYETPFKFCPWCAAPVELVEDEVVRKVKTTKHIPARTAVEYVHEVVEP